MSENDYDKQAAELARIWTIAHDVKIDKHCLDSLVVTVAAKLREQGEEIERLKELDRIGREDHHRLMADNAALKAEIAKLKAEKKRLNERFPCGHRKIDWDDSYGECVACKIKEQASDYDKLPLDIVGCHDELEAAEAKANTAYIAGLRAARDAMREVGGRFCFEGFDEQAVEAIQALIDAKKGER